MLGVFIRAGNWWDLPRRVLRAVRKWRFFPFFFPHTFCQCGTSMESPSGGDQRWLTDSGSALV